MPPVARTGSHAARHRVAHGTDVSSSSEHCCSTIRRAAVFVVGVIVALADLLFAVQRGFGTLASTVLSPAVTACPLWV